MTWLLLLFDWWPYGLMAALGLFLFLILTLNKDKP